jgi:hypothetical protein
MSSSITNVLRSEIFKQTDQLPDISIKTIYKQYLTPTKKDPLPPCALLSRLSLNAQTIALEYLDPEAQDVAMRVCAVARIQEGWTVEECTEERLRDLLVEKAVDLAGEAEARKKGYKKNVKLLGSGFWYGNDYFEALKEKGQAKRIESLKENDCFYYGLPPEGFTNDCTIEKINRYNLKPGTTASQGLTNVRTTLCFIDCQQMMQVASYEMLRNVLGRIEFNKTFKATGKTPLRLSPMISETPLLKFLTQAPCEKGTFGKRPIQKGDRVFFKNVPIYSAKHPQGEAGGFMTICTEDTPVQKFTAFGLPASGVHEIGIVDVFVEEYNKKPIADEAFSAKINALLEAERKPNAAAQGLGLQVEDARRIAANTTIFRGLFMEGEQVRPNEVGFFPRITRINVVAIQAALK